MRRCRTWMHFTAGSQKVSWPVSPCGIFQELYPWSSPLNSAAWGSKSPLEHVQGLALMILMGKKTLSMGVDASKFPIPSIMCGWAALAVNSGFSSFCLLYNKYLVPLYIYKVKIMQAGLTPASYRQYVLFLSIQSPSFWKCSENLEGLNKLRTSQYQLICPYSGCRVFIPSAVAQEGESRGERRGEGREGLGAAGAVGRIQLSLCWLRWQCWCSAPTEQGVWEALKVKREHQECGFEGKLLQALAPRTGRCWQRQDLYKQSNISFCKAHKHGFFCWKLELEMQRERENTMQTCC